MQAKGIATIFLLLFAALLVSGCDAVWGPEAIIAGNSSLLGTGSSAEPVVGPLCTSFCIDNGGYSLHGANLEHQSFYQGLLYVNRRGASKEGLDPSTAGETARWTSKYGSVTFNLVGYEFAWGGMNEAGLTLSTMSLRGSKGPAADERPPLEESMYAQYLLDNCTTIDEVMASDAAVRIVSPLSHFLVCDRTGECATVEFLKGKTVYHSGDDLPVKALTNHSYRDALKAWQKDKLSDQSLIRFGIAADRVRDYESADEESIVDYAFDTLYMADGDRRGGPSAQWSMVFDTENLRIHFRTKRNPQIRTIDLDKIDFSCQAPALMLDIHDEGAGDISDRLEPYSHEQSVDQFVLFFDAWNMDISRDRVEGLLQHLEGFSCASPDAQLGKPVPPGPGDMSAGGSLDAAGQDRPGQGLPGQGFPWLWLLAGGAIIPIAVMVWYVARPRSNQPQAGNEEQRSGINA